MDYRHEWKHMISPMDRVILRQRLRSVMKTDENAANGRYLIRSLYFDTPKDTALCEKIDGVNYREKFRIRYYNGDTSMIRLEKKSKIAGLSKKQSAEVTADEVQKILDGDLAWMLTADRPLVCELYTKMQAGQLSPKTIVEYTREPFVYAPGNVRVTMDYDIRTGLSHLDFLNPLSTTIPAGEEQNIILEVKWDEFLPDVIRSAVQLPGRRVTAFSKYAQCRIYG